MSIWVEQFYWKVPNTIGFIALELRFQVVNTFEFLAAVFLFSLFVVLWVLGALNCFLNMYLSTLTVQQPCNGYSALHFWTDSFFGHMELREYPLRHYYKCILFIFTKNGYLHRCCCLAVLLLLKWRSQREEQDNHLKYLNYGNLPQQQQQRMERSHAIY